MKKLSALSPGWDFKHEIPSITLFLFLILGIGLSSQIYAQRGVVPTQSPEGGFAVDGNLLARLPDSSPFSIDDGDFLPNEPAAGNGGSVFTLAGMPIDNATSFHVVDEYGNTDMNIFTEGSKFNHDPNTWSWKSGKPPAKDDMNHILFFFSSDAMGNIWFVGAGDRKKVQGNTYLDFELLQNPLYMEDDHSFNSMGPDGGRTIGDLAVTVEYTNGGSNPELYIYRWEASDQGGFDYIPVTPANGTTYLAVNSDSAIVVPYGAFGSNSYQEYAFTEVAVNINEVVPGMYACLDIKAVIAKTKASQSITAMLKDVIEPVPVDIRSGPVVSLQDTTICFGETVTLTPTIHSGTGPFTYEWSTGETTGSISVTPDTTTTYWVVVTGVNGCPSDTAYATVTVLPLPDCFIDGPATLCPLGQGQYMAPDTMVSYAWSVYGSGVILGDTSLQMVNVQGLGGCDASFILELTIVGSNGCANTCNYVVSLIDTSPPVFTHVPDPLWLDCASGVPDASIDSVTVEDDCPGNILVMVSDSILNGSCANQFDIIRTWTAVDTCGNLSTAAQSISVFDSIAPVFSYVPDPLWLECASEVPAASIDSVSVSDNCYGDIVLTVADSIVIGDCANQFDIIRTWTATDMCGNRSTASQSISVFDNLAPVFSYVPDPLWLECASDVPAASIDSVSVSDNCNGDIVLAVADSIVNGDCANQFDIIRTWTATDMCGNRSTASQAISVFDSIAPVIHGVPDDIVVCCEDSIPNLSGVYATDNCNISLLESYKKVVSDSTGPMDYTVTITWMFSDICGNMATESMIIEVDNNQFMEGKGMVGDNAGDKIVSYFSVAPNPFSHDAIISFSPAMEAYYDLELYNCFGVRLTTLYKQSLRAGEEVSISIRSDELVQGIYLLVLKTKYGLETRKLLLRR